MTLISVTPRMGAALAAFAALAAVTSLAACGAPRAAHAAPEQPRPAAAKYPYTEADVRFMTAMIGHHAQAVVIARWAPTHDASPAVRRLAERIVNAQQDEITLMQTWLRDRGRPAPAGPAPDAPGGGTPAPADEHAAHAHGAAGMPAMPGMLDAERLRRLDAARGAAFDYLFLTSMIEHHRGAVAMVKTLFESHGAGQDETVFKFASDVSVDQTTEIDRVLQMLLELGAPPRSP